MKPVDRLRALSLEQLAEALGYKRDRHDKSRWKRRGSVLSIKGEKFYDHLVGKGAGGAIDLVMHAEQCQFREALDILARMTGTCLAQATARPGPATQHWLQDWPGDGSLPCDLFDATSWPHVRNWLIETRNLGQRLIDDGYRLQLIGSDRRNNAVFVNRNAAGQPTGAELHGTQAGKRFKGMAPGSRKAAGSFWIRQREGATALVVESAIDALSAAMLEKFGHIGLIVSTAGLVTCMPAWMQDLQLYDIHCGFDACRRSGGQTRAGFPCTD